MRSGGRRRSIAFFVVLGSAVVGSAVALNVGWVIVSWRNAGLMVLGLLAFLLIVTGVVLNTVFLVREIRRNVQHEAFINAVTHELKTPVASMKLHLQTLQNRSVDESTRQEFYRVMLDDSERLLGTIEQVLRAGQLGARIRHTGTRSVDFGAIADECVSTARSRYRLAADALTYTESFNGVRPQVIGDEDDLRAVVSNLVDNAIKYSGNDIRVAVELEQVEPTTLTLRVRDRGMGISPSERKRIFKRFYRIPGVMATRIKGTGLGLFIVRSAVARHSGKVYVESDGPGHGSTFCVELPIAPGHAALAGAAPR